LGLTLDILTGVLQGTTKKVQVLLDGKDATAHVPYELVSLLEKMYSTLLTLDCASWCFSRFVRAVKLDEAILATIKHSAYGWDHITPSLVQLGIMMMDSVSALSPASSLNPGSASASLSSSGIIATSAPSTSPTSTSSSTKCVILLPEGSLVPHSLLHFKNAPSARRADTLRNVQSPRKCKERDSGADPISCGTISVLWTSRDPTLTLNICR